MEEALMRTPLRSALATALLTKTPLATSTKRKRLGTIQAPEVRIFHDQQGGDCATGSPVQQPAKKVHIREFSTQTSPPASSLPENTHNCAETAEPSIAQLSEMLNTPASKEDMRRVSYGGRVREALQALANACADPHMERAIPEMPEASTSMFAATKETSQTTTATSPMASAGVSTSTATSPINAATAFTMTTPHHTCSAATGASPLHTAATATMTSPAPAQDASTLTSPPPAAAALLSLVAHATPNTLRDQVETLAIGNELLRDYQLQLQASLDGAAGREASLMQQAEQERQELQRCVQQAAIEMDELCTGLFQRDEEIARLSALLSAQQAQPGLAPEEAVRLQSCEQQLHEMQEQVCQLQSTMVAQTTELEQARTSATQAGEQAKSEAGRAEQLARVNKMLQDDLRMTYNKQRQELAALQRTYQHDNYQARYQALLSETQTLSSREAMVGQLAPALHQLGALEAQAAQALEAACAAVEQKAQALLEEKTQMEAQLAAMAEQVAADRVLQAQALQDRDQALLEASEQQQAVSVLQEQYESMSVMAREMQGLFAQAQQALQDKDAMLEAAQGEQESLAFRLQEMVSTLQSKDDETVQLRADLDLLEEQRAQLQESIDTKAAETSKPDLEALATALTQRDELIATLTQQLDEQARQHAELRDFIAEERVVRQEVMDDGERELAALQLKCTASHEELMSLRLQLEATKTQHEQELQALRTQCELKQSDTTLESLHAQTTLAQLGGELVEKELQLYEAKAALAPMQAQLEHTRAQMAELERQLGERDKEVAHVKDYLKQFQERSQEKIATLQSNLATAEAEVQALDEELTRVMQQQQ